MSKEEKRTKAKYEAPTIVALGELAKGAGACTAGSGDSDACTAGGLASTCTAGPIATVGCTAGGLK
jgi:hypothetical protein